MASKEIPPMLWLKFYSESNQSGRIYGEGLRAALILGLPTAPQMAQASTPHWHTATLGSDSWEDPVPHLAGVMPPDPVG